MKSIRGVPELMEIKHVLLCVMGQHADISTNFVKFRFYLMLKGSIVSGKTHITPRWNACAVQHDGEVSSNSVVIESQNHRLS